MKNNPFAIKAAVSAIACMLMVAVVWVTLSVSEGGGGAAQAVETKPAAAAVETNDFEDWRMECLKTDPKQCQVFQRLANKNKAVVLAAVVSIVKTKDKDGKEKDVVRMRMAVPLGVKLRVGMAIKVDDGKQIGPLPFDICQAGGCIADFGIDKDFLDKVKNGKQILIAYRRQGAAKADTVGISLKGFRRAFDVMAEKAGFKG